MERRRAKTARISPYAIPAITPVRNLARVVRALEHDVSVLVRETTEALRTLRHNVTTLEQMYEEAVDMAVDIKDHNTGLAMQLHQRDDSIARLYRKCLFLEDQLVQAESLLHELETQENESGGHCLCCLEPAGDTAIFCSKGHRFCAECVDRRCASLVNDPCYALDSSVACMATDDRCDGRIVDLMRVEHGRAMVGDYYVHQAAEACLRTAKTNPVSLHFMRHDGTFRGLQCAHCQYGPLWNENCSELVSHHNQHTTSGAPIRNECPRCGWFVHDTRFLMRWNGEAGTAS